MLLFSQVLAAMPLGADELACAEVVSGPAKGASAIAESVLPAIHRARSSIHQDRDVDAPSADVLHAWVPTSLSTERVGGRAALVSGDHGRDVVVELQAPVRPGLVEANLTLIVDTSEWMRLSFQEDLAILGGPPTEPPLPVTKLELARAALLELVDQLPEGSRAALVAVDEGRGRLVLEPTTDTAAMRHAIDALEVGMLDKHDPTAADAAAEAMGSAFLPCADNRVLAMTHRADVGPVHDLLDEVQRIAGEGVQVWAFGIGSFQPIDVDRFLNGDGPNRARWILGARSDAQLVWRHLFSAGGEVQVDLELRVEGVVDGPFVKRIPRMGSGEHLGLVLPADPTAPVHLSLLVGDQTAIDATLPEGRAPTWALARHAFGAWTERPVPIVDDVSAELASWQRVGGHRQADTTHVWLESAWRDVGPAGTFTVVDLRSADQSGLPGDLELGLPELARHRRENVWRIVLDGQVEQVSMGERTVPVAVLGPRAAIHTRLEALRGERPSRTLLEAAVAEADAAPWDATLQRRLAEGFIGVEEYASVLHWAGRCKDDRAGPEAIACRVLVGRALVATGREAEAEKAYMEGVKRYRWGHPLWTAAGQLAYRQERFVDAEQRFLQALRRDGPSHPNCVHLGEVMEARELPGLAAVAYARALLIDPTDQTLRDRLFDLLEAGWQRAPSRYGRLGRIRPPAGKTSPAWLKKLVYRWGQAHKRANAIAPDRDDPWQLVVARPFGVIQGQGVLMTSVFRLGYPPGTMPERWQRYQGGFEKMFGDADPPIR